MNRFIAFTGSVIAVLSTGQAATLALNNDSFESALTGWTTTSIDHTPVEDPLPGNSVNSAQNTTFGSAYARVTATDSVLAQTLVETIQAGTYTLTWYSTDAFDDGGANTGGRAITGGLYVGGIGSTLLLGGTATTVAGTTLANLNDLGGPGTQFTYQYTVLEGDLNIGQQLTVKFNGGVIGFGGFGQSTIDGVSVDFVPEPSAALLGALGLIGLLRRRR